MVPKIVRLLFTTHNFDHCANSHSLYRPQGAVVFLPSLSAKAYRDDKASHTSDFSFFGLVDIVAVRSYLSGLREGDHHFVKRMFDFRFKRVITFF